MSLLQSTGEKPHVSWDVWGLWPTFITVSICIKWIIVVKCWLCTCCAVNTPGEVQLGGRSWWAAVWGTSENLSQITHERHEYLVPRLSSAQVKVLHKVLLVALPLHRLGSWVESHQYIHHLSWKLATLLPSPRGSLPCEHSRLTVACCYFHCSEGLQPFPALDLLLGTSTVLTGRFLAALLDLLERETQPPT